MKGASDTGHKKLKTNFYSVVVIEVRGVRGVQVTQDRGSVPGDTWGGGFPSAPPGGRVHSRCCSGPPNRGVCKDARDGSPRRTR